MTLPSYQCTIRDDRTSQSVAQSCNLAHDTITRSSARPFFSVPSPSASMTTSPIDKFVRSLLGSVNPGLSVQELEAVPSPRLQLLYNVKVSEGPNLLLALPPPAVMRLLRSEKSSIGSEAAVLKWLSGLTSSASRGKKTLTTPSKDSMPGKTSEEVSSSQRPANALSEYLPVLVRHEPKGPGLAVEYNLSRPPRGISIVSLQRPLTCKERRVVDFQTGQLIHQIALQLSPTRKFGIAADVLSVPLPALQARRLEGSLDNSRGADSWSVAFHSLMESILRDGEDLAVMISYGSIRRHFNRFEHLLDAVTNPRLVIVDAGEDINTLVVRPSDTGKKGVSLISEKTKGAQQKSKCARKGSVRPETNTSSDKNKKEYDDNTDSEEEDDYTQLADLQGKGHIKVTGLRQWANCLFGDPLIATVFSKHPTIDFWNGFDQSLSKAGDGEVDLSNSIIEDEPNAHIRLLLYECYHAVVAVIREFYRPQTDSSKRELAARKQLGSVLARLDELDDLGAPRRRRPSGEMSPAKRPKSGDEDAEDS